MRLLVYGMEPDKADVLCLNNRVKHQKFTSTACKTEIFGLCLNLVMTRPSRKFASRG